MGSGVCNIFNKVKTNTLFHEDKVINKPNNPLRHSGCMCCSGWPSSLISFPPYRNAIKIKTIRAISHSMTDSTDSLTLTLSFTLDDELLS